MKTLMIGGLAALALAGPALAQDGAHGPGRGDTDGDGRISRAEFLAVAFQRFDAADADRDGILTPGEAQAAREAVRVQLRGRVFEHLDADDDGTISRAEFDAGAERRDGRGQGRRGWARGRRGWGRELEADGVTRAEVEARASARFERLDANRDGFLSAEDREARRAARWGESGR